MLAGQAGQAAGAVRSRGDWPLPGRRPESFAGPRPRLFAFPRAPRRAAFETHHFSIMSLFPSHATHEPPHLWAARPSPQTGVPRPSGTCSSVCDMRGVLGFSGLNPILSGRPSHAPCSPTASRHLHRAECRPAGGGGPSPLRKEAELGIEGGRRKQMGYRFNTPTVPPPPPGSAGPCRRGRAGPGPGRLERRGRLASRPGPRREGGNRRCGGRWGEGCDLQGAAGVRMIMKYKD
jgi:hypothetical protein